MIFLRFFEKVFLIFNYFHLSPCRIVHINISRYLTKGRDEGKIQSGASLEIVHYATSAIKRFLTSVS